MFNRGHRPARRVLGILAAGALVAALAATTYAAIPGANGVISACRDAKGGLKVIDAENGATCSSNQVALNWNQQGPKGATGAKGDPGPSDVTYVKQTLSYITQLAYPGTVLQEMSLNAGSYLVSAKLVLNPRSLNVAPTVVDCYLNVSDGFASTGDSSEATVASNGSGPTEVATLALTQPTTFTNPAGGTVYLGCYVPASGQAAEASDIVITATHVGAVN